jgi:uncharacterized membrane protein YkvA (DUF1232 family)
MTKQVEKVGKVAKVERQQARGVMRGAVLLVPNFLKLLARLFRDARVPKAEKALLVGVMFYVLSPFDLLPDMIPVVGQVDDVYLVSLLVLRMLMRTPEDVLREHWDGGGNLPRVVERIARAAQFILPKRIRQVLLGRINFGPRAKERLLSAAGLSDEPEPATEKHARRAS